ncbi:MAG: hypothetical protein LUE92_10220 [Clostridiales bacterium]|nr:hypothetical protein [Clostridiales bacterium]
MGNIMDRTEKYKKAIYELAHCFSGANDLMSVYGFDELEFSARSDELLKNARLLNELSFGIQEGCIKIVEYRNREEARRANR